MTTFSPTGSRLRALTSCFTRARKRRPSSVSFSPNVIAPPSTTPAGSPPALIHLPTQLGGRAESPPYDDTIPGFAGNYDGPLLGSETYPRRMTGISPEIPAEHVDEFAATAAATYRVAIPEDLLEL